jgi:hypothetical protein
MIRNNVARIARLYLKLEFDNLLITCEALGLNI